MALDDEWAVVSETPVAASDEWEVVEETPAARSLGGSPSDPGPRGRARPVVPITPPTPDMPPNFVPMAPQMPMIPGPYGAMIQAAQDAANAPPPPSWADVMAQTPTQMSASSAQVIAGMRARDEAKSLFLASRPPEMFTPEWHEWVRQLEMAGEGGDLPAILRMHEINTDPAERKRAQDFIAEQSAIAAEAQADLDAAALPNRTLLQRGVGGVATSTPQAGAALTVGLATRNPLLAAASMSPMVAGQEFPGIMDQLEAQRAQQPGVGVWSPEALEQQGTTDLSRALFHSGLRGTSAAATELLPMHQLLKPGASFLQRLLGDVVFDIPGESIDTLVGAIDEEVVKKPQGQATMEDVQRGLSNGLAQLPETVVTTIMMGGTQAGIANAPQAVQNFVQGRRERAALDAAAARKETPVADEVAREDARRQQQERDARDFTLQTVTPEALDEIARRAEAAQVEPSFGNIVAPPISGSPAPEPGGAQAPTAPTATPPQGTASTPLSAAFQQPEPPAPPSTSAPPEPAPTPAPQAATAVSTAQKPPEGGAGPTAESDAIAREQLAALRSDPKAAAIHYTRDANGEVTSAGKGKLPKWRELPNKMQVREYVNVVDGERRPVQEIQLPNGKRYDRGVDYHGTPFDNVPLHLGEILTEGLKRAAPVAKPAPAAQAAPPPAPPVPVPQPAKPAKAAAPPSPQMQLFGTEAEPAPAAPKTAVAKAPPAQKAPPPTQPGLVGEGSQASRDSLDALLNDPAAHVRKFAQDKKGKWSTTDQGPAWTELGNGFAARQYINEYMGVRMPVQEIRSPNGGIAQRGLDTNGDPYGTLDVKGIGEFEEFFQRGRAQQPAAPAPQLPAPAKAAPKKAKKPKGLALPEPPPIKTKGARRSPKLEAEVRENKKAINKLWPEYQQLMSAFDPNDLPAAVADLDNKVQLGLQYLKQADTYLTYSNELARLRRWLEEAAEGVAKYNPPEGPVARTAKEEERANQIEELVKDQSTLRLRDALREERGNFEAAEFNPKITAERFWRDTFPKLNVRTKEYVQQLMFKANMGEPNGDETLREFGERSVKGMATDPHFLDSGDWPYVSFMQWAQLFMKGQRPLPEVRKLKKETYEPLYPKGAEPLRQQAPVEPMEGEVVPLPTTEAKFGEVIDAHAELFDDPEVKAHATDHPDYTKFLSPKEAKKRVLAWERQAEAQGKKEPARTMNYDKTIFSLFDLTGEWSQPYIDAGYNVIQLDLQTGTDILDLSVQFLHDNYPDIADAYGILIAAPCTDFTSAGARWFKDKDADGRTEMSKEMVNQALRLVDYYNPTFWVLENPVGRIKEATGLPDARYEFQPYDFGDPYTKKTQLYGKFNTNLPVAPVEPIEGSKMWSEFGGKSLATKNARSQTPKGFAYAFFKANNYADAPAHERLTAEYPDAAGAIEKALEAGFSEKQIRSAIEYIYENDDAKEARAALRKLVKTGTPDGEPTTLPKAEPRTQTRRAPFTVEAERRNAERLARERRERLGQEETEAEEEVASQDEDAGTAAAMAAEPMTDETLEDRRRPRPPPSKKAIFPYTQTREGEIRASPHDEIWTLSELDPVKMNLLPPPERFKAAAEIIKQRFMFRSVKKDPNLTWGDAIDALKDAFVGLTNHSAVANMNPGEVSLNGRLSLLLLRDVPKSEYPGPRAYFDPNDKTIGIIRRNDSFTHEWAHALDDMLLEKFAPELLLGKGQLLTGKIRSGGTPATMNAQVRSAFIDVVNSMFFDQGLAALYIMDLDRKIATAKGNAAKKQLQTQRDNYLKGHSKKQDIESDYYKRAKAMEGGASEGGYLQKPTEMFARAVEAYFGHKLAGYPADHPFVTKSDRMYNEQRVQEFPAVFPSGADRDNIFLAIDTLMRALRDAGLVQSGSAPAALTPTNTQYWKTLMPYLNEDAARKTRGILGRLKDDASASAAEMDRADEAAIRRKHQAAQTRAIRLDRANAEGLNRMTRGIALTAIDSGNALASGWLHSIRGVLLSLEEKYPGNPGIPQLIQWFATNPGSGKLQGPKFMEEVRNRERIFQNRLADVLEKHRVYRFTTEERMDLRDVIVNSLPSEAVAPHVAAAAVDMSKLTNDLYVYNTSNGVNIGYAKNGFLPRIIDQMAVEDDVDGFRRAARGLYSIVYDKEIGTLDEVVADREKLVYLLKQVAEIANLGRVPESKAGAIALLPLAERIAEQVKAIDDAPDGTDTTDLEADLEAMIEELRSAMRPIWAMEAANDWELRIRDIGARPEWEFEHRGIASKYTKSRTLPPETDTIMRDYLKNDAVELVSTYISQTVRRVEFGKMFGNPTSSQPLGWKLEEAMTAMKDPYRVRKGERVVEHRVSRDDREEIQQSINILLGTYNTTITQRGLRWMNGMNAFWTPVILARSLRSQLAEPFTASIKMDKRAGFQVLGKQLEDLYAWSGGSLLDYLINKTPDFMNLHDGLRATFKALGITGARQRAEWRQALGEFFGIVTNHLTDNVMAMRYNVLNQNTQDKLRLARFFRALGIHPHAMSMRRAIGEIFLTRFGPSLAKKALRLVPEAGGEAVAKQARKDLAELGIDARNDELLKELARLPEIKSMQELEQLRYLDEIRTAVNRMTSQTSQEPGAIDRAKRASLPETAILYAITGFQSGFTRNVLIASAKRGVQALRDDMKVGAGVNANMAIGFALLMGCTLAAWIAGVLAFDDGDWEEKKKKISEQWLGQTATRTGLFGTTDPIVNAFTGLKYQKDLATTMAGPIAAQPLSMGQAAGNLLARNSPSTATAEYQATKAAWNTIVAPWVTAKALRYVGRNPLIDTAFGIGIPYLTAPKVTNPLAETVAETVTGQEYLSPEEIARAGKGDREAIKAVERADKQAGGDIREKAKKRAEEMRNRP